MHEEVPENILKNTFTLTDLYRRADLMQRFLESVIFKESSQKGSRVERLRAYGAKHEAVADIKAVAAWGASVLNEYTAENLYERIGALKKAVEALPMMTLYVPVSFSAKQVELIGVWCRAHVRSDIMLDLKVNPATVGGCAIAYGSAYHDISFNYFLGKERVTLEKLVREYGEKK